MKKPAFEQFRSQVVRKGKSLRQQAREPYRAAIVELLESTGDIVINKSRKDGHDEALIDIRASWMGPGFSTEVVRRQLKRLWPGTVFEGGQEMHWIESEEEITVLDFAWENEEGQFLTGHILITP